MVLHKADRRRRNTRAGGAVFVVLLVAALAVPALRRPLASLIPKDRVVELNGLRFGYGVERALRLPMPDGVQLAATLYLPRDRSTRLATVLVREPYGRLQYGEGLMAAEHFARQGYAVLVQDLRGTGDSGGTLLPYRQGVSDGKATLDWVVAQHWSNGRVGTFGCSALGESQYVLALAHHPALRAMIPLGAGGAIGSAMVDMIFGSSIRRQMRRTNLRTCMGYKGYGRYGLSKDLWAVFNFEEGNRIVPEDERQKYLQMQAKAAISGRPETQELEF